MNGEKLALVIHKAKLVGIGKTAGSTNSKRNGIQVIRPGGGCARSCHAEVEVAITVEVAASAWVRKKSVRNAGDVHSSL